MEAKSKRCYGEALQFTGAHEHSPPPLQERDGWPQWLRQTVRIAATVADLENSHVVCSQTDV